jgi:hypothetical protein
MLTANGVDGCQPARRGCVHVDMTRALATLVAAVLVLTPAASAAQAPKTNAPPGNSAIDEYLETVPGAAGNQRPRPPAATRGSALTPVQRRKLEKLGPDGKTLARAVDATAPAAASPHVTGEIAAPSAGGRSPLSEVFSAVTGSDGGSGMGIALPAILVAALLTALVLALLRRRSAS